MSDQIQVSNSCWCCGQECMFCYPDNMCSPVTDSLYPQHWCSRCKYSGCEYCCGCDECRAVGRAGWSPPELPLEKRIPHLRGRE
jgi:hypothetical protein